jgi:hypothetical protein
MMRMKRVGTETCMTRTMKGIKVKEKKTVYDEETTDHT